VRDPPSEELQTEEATFESSDTGEVVGDNVGRRSSDNSVCRVLIVLLLVVESQLVRACGTRGGIIKGD
jgi:hypothetical protein